MSKVNFVIDPKEVSGEMVCFLTESNLFNDLAIDTLNDHPELKSRLNNTMSLEDQRKIIVDYVLSYYKDNALKFESSKKELEVSWNKIEGQVTDRLAELLKVSWPENKQATCYLGILNLYPRNLDCWTFHVHYLDPVNHSLAVILHELTHLLYFRKWAELFPKDSSETYEAPHPFWHLSEVLAAVINTDPKLRKLIPEADNIDDPSYKELPIKEGEPETIHDYFLRNYQEYIQNDKSIEDFLKFAREEAPKINFGF